MFGLLCDPLHFMYLKDYSEKGPQTIRLPKEVMAKVS